MRRYLLLLALAGMTACTPDGSSLPEATGKGIVRAIGAIPTSPEIGFLIEERGIGGVAFKAATTPQSWDNLGYNFNFDVLYPGDARSTRVATRFLDVVAGSEFTFLLTGDLDAPDVTVWETPVRVFGTGDTVFELRIANASAGIGAVDVYVAEEGVAPALGEQAATVALTEISTAADFETDEYVLTVTPAGDPATILFVSNPTTILAQQSVLLILFDGDANDLAPYAVRLFNNAGGASAVPDARFLPPLRFIHATMDLETADIYDDEMVTNAIVTDLAFGDVTGEIEFPIGETPLTVTPAGNPGVFLYETIYTAFGGVRTNFFLITDPDDEIFGTRVVSDRRSIETAARFTFFHAAKNNPLVNLYLLEPDEPIDGAGVLPRQINLAYGFQSPIAGIQEGSYDLYFAVGDDRTVVDGPIRLDLAKGDVIEGVLLDRVDPALAEFRLLPPP